MGLFDTITVVDYPLPDGIVRKDYQTKSFDHPYLDEYQIRADGTLWREDYDIEDHSDPNAKGIMKFAGSMTRVHKRWVRDYFTGQLRFYDYDLDKKQNFEFKAEMLNGKVLRIERVEG